MALDPSIILAGQAPNIIGAIDAGNIAGQRRNEFVRTNALNAFLQQNGPGVMSGDENALAGLARFDPTAALGVQDTRQQMAYRDETMAMARQQAVQQAQAQAAQMTAEQRAQEAAQLERILGGASSFYAQGDQAGYTSWLQQNNLDPAQYPFEQFPAIAATAGDVLDTLKTFQDMNAAPAGLTFRPATPEEAASYGAQAGQFDTSSGRFYPADLATGMSITTNPNGGMTLVQGPGAGAAPGQMTAEQKAASNQTTASDVIINSALRAATAAQDRVLTGGFGALAAYNPGNTNAELYRQVQVLKSNASIANIQAMREASPTGAALGAASDSDMRILEAKSGALDPASPNFQRDLADYTQTLLRIVHGVNEGDRIFNEQYVTALQTGGETGGSFTAAPVTPAPPPQTVTANGPTQQGPVTVESIRTMTPMQFTEYVATLTPDDIAKLPTDVLRAITERPQ